MTPDDLRALLSGVHRGDVSPESAADRLLDAWRRLPFEDLGYARVDHHRALRQGFPEVVFGAGKTPEQVAAIADRIAASGYDLLVTRTSPAAWEAVSARPARRRVPRVAADHRAACAHRADP